MHRVTSSYSMAALLKRQSRKPSKDSKRLNLRSKSSYRSKVKKHYSLIAVIPRARKKTVFHPSHPCVAKKRLKLESKLGPTKE